jgi:ABC-type antimicrobial peptide transport system permease subunit
MTQRQVSAVVILYAVVVACLAAVLGLVVGALIANVGWHVFSQSVGFAWPVTLPARAVAFVAVGAVLVATAIATAVSLSPLSRRPGRLN